MPRKPFTQQRRYDISARGANHVITWCRKDVRIVGSRRYRYFVGKYAGVTRLAGNPPLIHNGRKAR